MARAALAALLLACAACSVEVGSGPDSGGLAPDAAAAKADAALEAGADASSADAAAPPGPDAADPSDAEAVPPDAGAAGADAGPGQPDSATTPPDAGSTPADAAVVAADSGFDPKPLKVTYPVDTTTNFANPERGFYHHEETQSSGYSALDQAAMTAWRTQDGISLVLRMWYLAGYAAKDLDPAILTAISTDLARVRGAGLKAVVRFAYSDSETDSPRDATKAQVLAHVAQLKPVFEANADVIAAVQAGFVGVWGEWYYTDHFGDEGTISAAQWADRKEVVAALLGASGGRPVLLRTPLFKQTMYGAAALTGAEAFGGSDKARVGHHNDCFLASADDYGTYQDVAADKAYLALETQYVPIGGETCATSSYSGWANAAADMSRMHWTFLNIDYNASVISGWGANLAVARRSLGYRLALVEGTYASVAKAGGKAEVSFTVRNDGYAAPFSPRGLQLVLRETTSKAVHAIALSADPRRWLPGTPPVVAESVDLAGVPAGTYDAFLFLPDPAASLSTRPEYAIRLANTGLWEAATGYNDLKLKVTVVP